MERLSAPVDGMNRRHFLRAFATTLAVGPAVVHEVMRLKPLAPRLWAPPTFDVTGLGFQPNVILFWPDFGLVRLKSLDADGFTLEVFDPYVTEEDGTVVLATGHLPRYTGPQ